MIRVAKSDYIAQIRERLARWDTEISQIDASPATDDGAGPRLRRKFHRLEERLGDIEEASEETWETLTIGMESALARFEQALDETKSP